MRGRVFLLLSGLTVTLGVILSSCSRADEVVPVGSSVPLPAGSSGRSRSAVQARAFDKLIDDLQGSYVYSQYFGVDWEGIRNRYRSQILSADNRDYERLMRMAVGELPDGSTTWQSRSERIETLAAQTSSYEGIGAYVAYRDVPRPRVILLSVMPGSPAAQAGLHSHDAILAIDGIPVSLEEGADAVMRIRGLAGTPVSLTVRSPGVEPRQVTVTRGRVELTQVAEQVFASILANRIGYLRVPRPVTQNLIAEVIGLLQTMEQRGPLAGVILDLRIASARNWPLGELMTIFGTGDMGSFYTAESTRPITITGENIAGSQTLPLAVLVGPDTEGQPEVLAAALQAAGRATVIGRPTGGIIEREEQISLADGSRAFVLASSYRTRDARDVGLEGVTPDILAREDWDTVVSPVSDPVVDVAIAQLSGGV